MACRPPPSPARLPARCVQFSFSSGHPPHSIWLTPLLRSLVVSACKQQQTAASCMTALCPLCLVPLATCRLPLDSRLIPLASRLLPHACPKRDVYHYYRDSRPARSQNPSRSRPRQLCVHLATPPTIPHALLPPALSLSARATHLPPS